ncbi:MAG: hypothetical protein HYU36_24125 [Planctomycetes bacterium]|nr:hypothetical protein [Planctomycetota bacterium]
MRPCAVVFNLFLPGLGHLLLGYSARGLILFILFGLGVDGFLIGLYGPGASPSDTLALSCALLAVLLWAYGVYDAWWRAFGRFRPPLQAEKTKHFRAGVVHYLSADYDAALRELRFVLRLDDEDADTLYYLGLTLKAAGQPRLARHCFRRCLAHDGDQKWHDEVGQQLQELRP